MPETNLADLIEKIFRENHRNFMTLKQVVFHMPTQAKRDLGILNLTNAAEIQKILAPVLDSRRYVFHRRGTFIFVLEPKSHEEFILDTLDKKARTPKDIARLVPFSKKETANIIVDLINKNILNLTIDDDLQTRIHFNKKAQNNQPEDKPAPAPEPEKTPEAKPEPPASPESQKENPYAEYTVENFRKAFHSLDNGRIYVRICDLRKTLGWPRAIFDSALKQLRDAKLIQLHVGDVTLMTPAEVQDCFVDENNFRMGTVTWHGR